MRIRQVKLIVYNKIISKLKEKSLCMAMSLFLVGVISPFAVIVFFNIPYPSFINNALKVDNIGSVGDFLSGTMTPFFTMAAFMMLVKSYFLQKEELKATREEMKASAEALEAQKKIMEEEAKLTVNKNTLDIFFMLYNNWRKLAKEKIFNVYYQVVINDDLQRDSVINCYEISGLPAEDNYINISDYGKHLKALLRENEIQTGVNFVNLPTVRRYSNCEYSLIIDNLRVNVLPLVCNLNNLLSYIKRNNNELYNKMILDTLASSMSWGEKFVLNMIVSDFILGAITEEEQWRCELKANISYLGIEMENYDGHDEKFKKENADS